MFSLDISEIIALTYCDSLSTWRSIGVKQENGETRDMDEPILQGISCGLSRRSTPPAPSYRDITPVSVTDWIVYMRPGITVEENGIAEVLHDGRIYRGRVGESFVYPDSHSMFTLREVEIA